MPRPWRSSPKAFANLRAHLEWYADYGKTTLCCASATAAEIQENARLFDCQQCPHVAHEHALWAVNARALAIYHRLCGRTVVDLGLAGWLFQTLTDGWTPADVLDLVTRLELIRSVLDPPRTKNS